MDLQSFKNASAGNSSSLVPMEGLRLANLLILIDCQSSCECQRIGQLYSWRQWFGLSQSRSNRFLIDSSPLRPQLTYSFKHLNLFQSWEPIWPIYQLVSTPILLLSRILVQVLLKSKRISDWQCRHSFHLNDLATNLAIIATSSNLTAQIARVSSDLVNVTNNATGNRSCLYFVLVTPFDLETWM